MKLKLILFITWFITIFSRLLKFFTIIICLLISHFYKISIISFQYLSLNLVYWIMFEFFIIWFIVLYLMNFYNTRLRTEQSVLSFNFILIKINFFYGIIVIYFQSIFGLRRWIAMMLPVSIKLIEFIFGIIIFSGWRKSCWRFIKMVIIFF